MLNWFRSKAALIAENDELRASLYESEGNVDMFRKSYHHEKERANRYAGNLMASRVELEMLRAREQHRIDNLRTWGRRGALVTNAKRAAK